MFETAFTLSLTQFARTLSFPERLQHRAARNGVLEAWRMRNTGLDGLFYDVAVLTSEEVYYISDALAAEGLIMIVPPSGGPMLTVCDSIDEYLTRGGRDVHVLAIAGMGGSAIGAAAFARNVANAVGEPVAAVVSGYGLGDIVSDTIGANFLFGWLGNLRGECEVIDDVVGRPKLGAYESRHALALKPRPSGLDVDTVESLLADESLSFKLLAGHSRGNLVLSQALYALRAENPARIKAVARQARIVTFGARITMPPDFRSVIDVIGELDWYGEINSRPMIDTDIRVPMAGHSTNTGMPGALRVTPLLQSILADGHPALTVDASPVPAPEPVPEPTAVETSPSPAEQDETVAAIDTVVALATVAPIEVAAPTEPTPEAEPLMASASAPLAETVEPLNTDEEPEPTAPPELDTAPEAEPVDRVDTTEALEPAAVDAMPMEPAPLEPVAAKPSRNGNARPGKGRAKPPRK